MDQKTNRPWYRVNPKLVPLKILIFILYGGMAALYPYLTIHMKSLGLTITETAIVYALLPVLCCVGPAITGALADKLGYYKFLLVGAIIVNIGLHTLLYFGVPTYSVTNVTHVHNASAMEITLPCLGHMDPANFYAKNDLLTFSKTSLLDNKCQPAANMTDVRHLIFDQCSTNCGNGTHSHWDTSSICFPRAGNTSCTTAEEIIHMLDDISGSRNLTAPNFSNESFFYVHCTQPAQVQCTINCTLRNLFKFPCVTEVTEGNRQATFWLYFVFRVLASIALAAVFPLMDAATIQMSEEYGGNIGMQRMYSLLGMCLVAPLAGLLIDKLDMGYAPAFYLYDAMHVLAAIAAAVMSLSIKLPAENIWKNVGTLLKIPRVVVFIAVVFFIGAAWGLIDSFLFWFMEEELTSPKWLLGFTSTVGGLCGVPVMATATLIIERFGHTNILIFSMFVYGIRYIGYSFVYDPYMVLPLEALEAFTNSLMWITALIYAAKIAPLYLATLQGIVGGMHYGIGRGAGALTGGLMIRAIGARSTWRIFAGVCFACGTLYGLLQFFWLRKQRMPGQESPGFLKENIAQVKALSTHQLAAMNEDQEEKLQEVAMLNVLRGTAAAEFTGSVVDLSSSPVNDVPDPKAYHTATSFDDDDTESSEEFGEETYVYRGNVKESA